MGENPDAPDTGDGADGATVFVLYGATGDLAHRMVLPAFRELAQRGLMPERWRLVGSGRGDVSHAEFREQVAQTLRGDDADDDADAGSDQEWKAFADRLLFAGGGFTADDPGSLLDVLGEVRGDLDGDPLVVHYLAVPPRRFADYTRAIDAHDLTAGARVVYEKPFGQSPESFRELDELVGSVLSEEQVFRIDHFLGKEGSQDLHVLRFGNALFAGIWDRRSVEQVQVDIPETLDIVDRAEFYDDNGAALDMLVTHLFQLAAEVAMEPPASMGVDDLRAARDAALAAFRPLDPDEVVLGQFDGYRDTDGVDGDSQTDTFVAARLWVDTDRWRDVPFLLRTGKRMAADEQRVSLLLRPPQGPLTHLPKHAEVVSLSLSGGGTVDLSFVAKQPGTELTPSRGTARLDLRDVAGGDPLPPYASLLHDVLTGDRSLFTTTDGLAAAWRAFAPLLEHRPGVEQYAPGSWGPEAAQRLAEPGRWLLGP